VFEQRDYGIGSTQTVQFLEGGVNFDNVGESSREAFGGLSWKI
jgi:hypothetical protein